MIIDEQDIQNAPYGQLQLDATARSVEA